jgi:hypothetical protein
VVVVSQGQRIAGLLYCKERVLAGIGIHIVYGDDTLGAMVAACPEETESVVNCGVKALLKHMVALRFLVSSHWLPFLRSVHANAEVNFCPWGRHAHLDLPRSYDEFLVKLGPRTRRNFRYYRRKCERAGNEFSPVLVFSDFCAAARRLLPKAAYAASQVTLERNLEMIEAMDKRMLMGLRRMDGEWIGLAGGWYAGDCAILKIQLNDRTCSRESVSLVLRSYMIEALINREFRELVFWGGSSAPLSFYSVYPDVYLASVDVQSLPWRLCRLAWARVRRLAPGAFSKLLPHASW